MSANIIALASELNSDYLVHFGEKLEKLGRLNLAELYCVAVWPCLIRAIRPTVLNGCEALSYGLE
jgi:hypothetical protein